MARLYFVVALISMFIISSVCVVAVSMAIPGELEDERETLYINDSTKLDFTIRGDSSAQTVEFFMKSSNEYAKFNGQNPFSMSIPLSLNYGSKTVDVTVTGVKNGTEIVEYGYRFGSSSSGSIAMDQLVQNTYTLVVRCRGSCASSSDLIVTVPASTGGGGGGAGGILPPTTNGSVGESPLVVATPPSSSQTPYSPELSDVSAGTGGIASGVVSAEDEVGKRTEKMIESGVAVVKKAGYSVAIALLVMLVISTVLSGALLKTAKGVEFS